MLRRRAFTAGAAVFALSLTVLLLHGCAKSDTPADVALEYGRAVFASDAAAIYRLVSEDDRRVRDEATFRGQQRELRGFTRELVRQLASYITATPVTTTGAGRR